MAESDPDVLVPITVSGTRAYVTARAVGAAPDPDDESEIGSRRPSLDEVVDSLNSFATELGTKLRETGASKVSVEFGCEVAVESGSLVAIIGKASGRTTFKVGLEWTTPTV